MSLDTENFFLMEARSHWSCQKRGSAFLCSLLLIFSFWNGQGHSETSFSDLPTGLVKLDDFRYPVYVSVPEDYRAGKSLSMILVIPDGKDSLKKTASSWSSMDGADRFLIVVPEVKFPQDDVPYKTDDWLLNVKKTLALRYGTHLIYLVGKGTKAHYAAYLGLKYPQEFSAVMLLGDSWVGPFEKLTKLSERPKKQEPFFVALPEKDKKAAAVQERAQLLLSKGYPIRVVMLEQAGEEDTSSFRKDMLTWGEKAVVEQAEKIKQNQGKFQEKFSTALEDFFAVK